MIELDYDLENYFTEYLECQQMKICDKLHLFPCGQPQTKGLAFFWRSWDALK